MIFHVVLGRAEDGLLLNVQPSQVVYHPARLANISGRDAVKTFQKAGRQKKIIAN